MVGYHCWSPYCIEKVWFLGRIWFFVKLEMKGKLEIYVEGTVFVAGNALHITCLFAQALEIQFLT